MAMRLMSHLTWLPAMLLAGSWLIGPSHVPPSWRPQLLSGPFTFRLLDWEVTSVGSRLGRVLGGFTGTPELTSREREVAVAYLEGSAPERERLRSEAEPAIERSVAHTYARHGAGRSPVTRGLFPPVLVSFDAPPEVLVVSPRDELRVVHSVLLRPVPNEVKQRIEVSADSGGVSSLVTSIGGLATYPSMIPPTGSAQEIVAATAHEWVHHYLAFHPLGAGYWASAEARSIGETVADLVAREVAGEVLAELGIREPPPVRGPAPAFDFRGFMRETRLELDRLLAERAVDAAEQYLRERRDVLETHGYAIRKLNQAYFALHGSYGEGFAASPSSPIPDLLRRLRSRAPDLGAFLARVRDVASVDELRALAQRG